MPSRRYLEIAAWLKREPDDWPQLEAVRKARIVLEDSFYLVPMIEASCEDPINIHLFGQMNLAMDTGLASLCSLDFLN